MTAPGLFVVAASALAIAIARPVQEPTTVSSPHARVEFEDDQVRVLRLSLGPGETATIQDHPDAVLVHLTADLAGRLPPAEAVWQPAGALTLENRARTGFEALLVELTAPASAEPAHVAPEAAPVRIGSRNLAYRRYDGQGRRVRTLVDNARVTVTKQRLDQPLATEPLHFHRRNVVVVYLRGGLIDGTTGRLGWRHARRGEFDLLPAETLHAFRNVGYDPIEFLMIAPK